jgi:hypothetical protein
MLLLFEKSQEVLKLKPRAEVDPCGQACSVFSFNQADFLPVRSAGEAMVLEVTVFFLPRTFHLFLLAQIELPRVSHGLSPWASCALYDDGSSHPGAVVPS